MLPPIVILPVIVPPARGSLVAMLLVIVVEKLGSSPSAAASSFNVSSAPGAESTRLATSVSTYPLVAASVEATGVATLLIRPFVISSVVLTDKVVPMFTAPVVVTASRYACDQ